VRGKSMALVALRGDRRKGNSAPVIDIADSATNKLKEMKKKIDYGDPQLVTFASRLFCLPALKDFTRYSQECWRCVPSEPPARALWYDWPWGCRRKRSSRSACSPTAG